MITKKELYHRLLEVELDIADLNIRLEKLAHPKAKIKKEIKTSKPSKKGTK